MVAKKFTFIDLFAGIGGLRLPFQELGGECVFSSEWDSYAQKTYEANFGEIPAGDITKVPSGSIPDHDILLAGISALSAKSYICMPTQYTCVSKCLKKQPP